MWMKIIKAAAKFIVWAANNEETVDSAIELAKKLKKSKTEPKQE